jgi:hypothetical protein
MSLHAATCSPKMSRSLCRNHRRAHRVCAPCHRQTREEKVKTQFWGPRYFRAGPLLRARPPPTCPAYPGVQDKPSLAETAATELQNRCPIRPTHGRTAPVLGVQRSAKMPCGNSGSRAKVTKSDLRHTWIASRGLIALKCDHFSLLPCCRPPIGTKPPQRWPRMSTSLASLMRAARYVDPPLSGCSFFISER